MVAVVGGVVLWPHPDGAPSAEVDRTLGTVDLPPPTTDRDGDVPVSRSGQRVADDAQPGKSGIRELEVPAVTAHRWTTATLNVWSGPGEDTALVGQVDSEVKVAVTGTEEDGWSQIIRDGMPRWVNAGYLSTDKPQPPTVQPPTVQPPTVQPPTVQPPTVQPSPPVTADPVAPSAVSYAPCRLGSSVESGLTPDAVRVYRAVCAAFPSVTSYGGLRPGDSGEHGTGQALDIMVADQGTGDEIAAWVIAHRSDLGVSEVLWWQQIWTVDRSGEGWRPLEDRGSSTANHYDHVHVTVYGDSAG